MKLKLLSVDDSRAIRMIIGKALARYDCDVLQAPNGLEGLQTALREKPDLIILDYTMPVMDGAEMLARLRGSAETRDIPVIMLTAEAGKDTVLRIARLGVKGYLIKPFTEEQLVERLKRVVDLQIKQDLTQRPRRFDDPLEVLVVDDKAAIVEQIRTGLADLPWVIQGCASVSEAVAAAGQRVRDVVLVNLALPDNGAFSLFQTLRASAQYRNLAIFGMCVRIAVEDQNRAQESGFTGVVTKPIDFEDLKNRLGRALRLDMSYKFFQEREEVLVLKVPARLDSYVFNNITAILHAKVAEAVDAGFDKLLVDLSALRSADINVIRLGLAVVKLCQDLSMRMKVVVNDDVHRECRVYEETKDWNFVRSLDEGIANLKGTPLVPA